MKSGVPPARLSSERELEHRPAACATSGFETRCHPSADKVPLGTQAECLCSAAMARRAKCDMLEPQ
jgi:hypothetical protein